MLIIMQDVYVFGTGVLLAQTFADFLIEDSRYNFRGFTVNAQFRTAAELNGYPVLPFEEIGNSWGGGVSPVILNCVGYSKMLTLRQKAAQMIKQSGFPLLTYVHPSAQIQKGFSIGEDCLIYPHSAIERNVKIGDGNILAGDVYLSHEAVVGDYNFFATKSLLCGRVTIENHCFIGAHSTVQQDIKIADFTLIGANAYIAEDTEPYGVYVPQRSIKLAKASMDLEI